MPQPIEFRAIIEFYVQQNFRASVVHHSIVKKRRSLSISIQVQVVKKNSMKINHPITNFIRSINVASYFHVLVNEHFIIYFGPMLFQIHIEWLMLKVDIISMVTIIIFIHLDLNFNHVIEANEMFRCDENLS